MQRSPWVRLWLCASIEVALLLPSAVCAAHDEPSVPQIHRGQVGRVAANRFVTPTGQVLTPAGRQVNLPGMRPQVLALSPDGRLLATAGRNNSLAVIDPAKGQLLQTIHLSVVVGPRATPSGDTQASSGSRGAVTNTAEISFTGLIFSVDGRRLYLSNANGNVWRFGINEGRVIAPPAILEIPDGEAPQRRREIPSGLALSQDGQRLYVAGNLGGRLYELDALSGALLRSWKTGVAPYDVVLTGSKAYVSNLGGRFPRPGELTAPAGKGTTVRVDAEQYIALEGSVTVIDLVSGQVASEIPAGRHTSALAVSPGGSYVVVANTGDDTLSVIDTRTDQISEKIWARQTPAELFGAQPNALTFAPDGKRLYVCNGTQNAIAVVDFRPRQNASQVIGSIPVGWFPGAIQFDASRKQLCVANIKGIGAAKVLAPGKKSKLNTKDFFGTVSLVPLPGQRSLASMTKRALQNLRYPRIAESLLPARDGEPVRPVPERPGEPSRFKHVIYVIKENRSYDQILGDMPQGNGDTNLCIFGEQHTPNQHKIAREFVLLDNTYCSGVQSGDGHQWTDSAMANEYVERQLTSGHPRSYASGKTEDGVDALAWASSGFIWNNALAHGKTFRNYGEWMISQAGWKDPKRKDKILWRDFWEDFQSGSCATQVRCRAGVESLRQHSSTNTAGWDLKVPDLVRADRFIRELRQFETTGDLPDFIILFLPNDHSAGTSSGYPTPGAQVADNDLALGRVVEAVSHSRFWPETCLFAIEDDPQAGWDHVSGYRTTCYVVSPYTKRRRTVSAQYNQCSLIRTIELILGLPPMNQLDAAVMPMSDCFTDKPDFTPFTSVPNRVPLDQLNPDPKKVADRVLRQDAITSNRLPLAEPDRCPEDVLNRILWRAMKGPKAPYPEWAVKVVADLD